MRRVLLACPLKGELSSWFVRNLLRILKARIPDVELEFSFLEGAPVQQARNEIVEHARRAGYNELVMLDKDLDAGPEAIEQLLSHEDAPVVCGLYCQRSLDTFWHVQGWSQNEVPDATGLLRVRQCAIGFSKIRLEIFDQLEKANPDRLGLLTDAGGGVKPIWEFFPMELVGANTPRARVSELSKLCAQFLEDGRDCIPVPDIHRLLTTTYLTDNLHTSEDHGFCAMLRASNIPIKVDTNLIVQHETGVKLPIKTDQLLKMIKESWRNDVA